MKNVTAFLFMVVFMLVFIGMAMSAEIHKAAKKGSLEKVKAFLANGEKVDVKDEHEMTPLFYAAAGGHKDICEYLISQGADVNAGREIGFIPLGAALNNRTESGVEIFKFLVAHGADININIGGLPQLHQAVYSCHNENVRNIAEFLILKGADINAKGYKNKTPLHMVGCIQICELLISKGADIKARDKYGRTPLFEACSSTRSKKKICEFLLTKGADVNAKDNQGLTPLHQALKNKHKDVAALLKKHGGVK